MIANVFYCHWDLESNTNFLIAKRVGPRVGVNICVNDFLSRIDRHVLVIALAYENSIKKVITPEIIIQDIDICYVTLEFTLPF